MDGVPLRCLSEYRANYFINNVKYPGLRKLYQKHSWGSVTINFNKTYSALVARTPIDELGLDMDDMRK